jgi:hypothetical protein
MGTETPRMHPHTVKGVGGTPGTPNRDPLETLKSHKSGVGPPLNQRGRHPVHEPGIYRFGEVKPYQTAESTDDVDRLGWELR